MLCSQPPEIQSSQRLCEYLLQASNRVGASLTRTSCVVLAAYRLRQRPLGVRSVTSSGLIKDHQLQSLPSLPEYANPWGKLDHPSRVKNGSEQPNQRVEAGPSRAVISCSTLSSMPREERRTQQQFTSENQPTPA